MYDKQYNNSRRFRGDENRSFSNQNEFENDFGDNETPGENWRESGFGQNRYRDITEDSAKRYTNQNREPQGWNQQEWDRNSRDFEDMNYGQNNQSRNSSQGRYSRSQGNFGNSSNNNNQGYQNDFENDQDLDEGRFQSGRNRFNQSQGGFNDRSSTRFNNETTGGGSYGSQDRWQSGNESNYGRGNSFSNSRSQKNQY